MDQLTHTLAEVAQALRVSERWLADRVRAGEVEHLRLENRKVYFTREQVDALLERRTQRAARPGLALVPSAHPRARRTA